MPLLIGLALLLATGPAVSTDWVRVESPNFVVFGEVGEKRTRQYAAEFERFRDALGRIVPTAAARPAAPALVFVFKSAESFAPYRPVFNGKPVQVSGYFAGGADLDVILFAGSGRDGDSLRTVYHEYSHLVTVNMLRGLPAWLAEGLAEYYSTFEVRDEGRAALLGGIIPSHLLRLNHDRLLPLEQLITIDTDSPLYNEGSKRSTFYAQSWALVHMLLNGDPDRSAQFNEYVRLAASGQSSLEAWNAVFGQQPILDQLRRYVTQSRMKGFLFRFDRQIGATTFTVSTPTPADVHAALGELRLHVAPETASAHMAQSPQPPGAFTAAVNGTMLARENRPNEALPLLLEAAQSSDWLVQYRAAAGLERIAIAGPGDASRTAARAADAALQRVLQQKPDLPHAIAMRGLIAGPSDEGLELLKRARRLAPGRAYYAVWQAQYHSTRGEFARAREILAPMLSASYPKDTREYARAALAEAATEQITRERSAHPSTAASPSAGRPLGSGQVLPGFRQLQPGEQRTEATLERIECPRSGVILHVRLGERPARFAATELRAVQFLTYRGDDTAPISCGARTPPDKIYLTWRAATDSKTVEGIAVAVEFLPR
jgi:hypothetical protein